VESQRETQNLGVELVGPVNLLPNSNAETTTSVDKPDMLSVFLVGAFSNFVGLLTTVPIALLTRALTSSEPALPALTSGLKLIVERENALLAYSVYIVINTAFNLSLICTTSYGSALLSFLSLKAVVPLTAICSAIPWPVIGAKPLIPAEWGALGVMFLGIAGFRLGNMKRESLNAKN